MYAFFTGMIRLLLPLGICVVLPVLITWLILRYRSEREERKQRLLLNILDRKGEMPNSELQELVSVLNSGQDKSRKSDPARRLVSLQAVGWACLLLGIFLLICIILIFIFTHLKKGFADLFSFMVFMLFLDSLLLSIGAACLVAYHNAARRLDNPSGKE